MEKHLENFTEQIERTKQRVIELIKASLKADIVDIEDRVIIEDSYIDADFCYLDSIYREGDNVVVSGFWKDGNQSIFSIDEIPLDYFFHFADWFFEMMG